MMLLASLAFVMFSAGMCGDDNDDDDDNTEIGGGGSSQSEYKDKWAGLVNEDSKSVSVDGTEYTYYSVPGSGIAVISTVGGFGGPLTLMVGIDEAGLVVNTVVLSHSETPGLGAKCAEESAFTEQFKGWNPAQKVLAVRKDGGEVDAITASTITSRAYSAAIANAYKVYLNLKGDE